MPDVRIKEVMGPIPMSASSVLPVSGSFTFISEDPLLKYKLSDIGSISATNYSGYLDKDGRWYIMRETSTEVRYCSGANNYITNWSNRVNLDYAYFNEVF